MISNTARRNLDRFLENELKLEERLPGNLETDMDELHWNIQFTEKMFPNCILMLCNARHRNFEYISASCKDILGYSPEQFRQIVQDNFLSVIHPNDLEAVSVCFHHIVKATAGLDDLTKARFCLNYRLKHANGNYLNILDEKIMIESRSKKYIGFTLLKDISSTASFSVVKLEEFKQIDNHFLKIDEFVPNQRRELVTSREMDVVNLIREGFNSKEIAARLSLSIHTVKNHRRKLFKKMKVRNSIELLKQAQSIKLT
ncbi:LuxR C-terminal-related transcriptional regulator [Dawidia soli]|uniref:PAS domain-containing protein n=1 Tax=Dawidia soli TaxID=2782352 RepID=A0AAP2GKR1_9BACT|nr:LuxR C-terminal-related transcriptional regulator [Dawidia soli]MBT1689885.1 PAS domain-containing protein [Dawidia soli]